MTGPRRESRAERTARRAEVSDPTVVLDAAFRFLEARGRSISETRRRLTEAGYRPALIEQAIERLETIGLLDDEVFARHWVEARDRASPRGEAALRRELSLRGVAAETIVGVLAARRSEAKSVRPSGSSLRHRLTGESATEPDVRGSGSTEPDDFDPDHPASADEAAAARLLERRRRDLERIADPRARRARAYALLARHGFAPDIAARLAARSAQESDED